MYPYIPYLARSPLQIREFLNFLSKIFLRAGAHLRVDPNSWADTWDHPYRTITVGLRLGMKTKGAHLERPDS